MRIDPPVVTTSSTSNTLTPEWSAAPSIHLSRPRPLGCFRTENQRQLARIATACAMASAPIVSPPTESKELLTDAMTASATQQRSCLLYTSDAADEEDSVDLGGRRIIKKKKKNTT